MSDRNFRCRNWKPTGPAPAGPRSDPGEILKASQVILLIDWPSPKVPRALVESGFTVFGFSPHHYSKAELVFDVSEVCDSKSVFPPQPESEKGYLVFRQLAARPTAANIVSVYRPPNELAGILADHALPLGATVIWLQRPLASAEERRLVEERGLTLVEGCDIAEAARALRNP